jgi:hypothetical protein
MLDRLHQRAIGLSIGLVKALERRRDGGRVRRIERAIEQARELLLPEPVLGPTAGIREAERRRDHGLRVRGQLGRAVTRAS